MTDRELLEWAAKAAGVEYDRYVDGFTPDLFHYGSESGLLKVNSDELKADCWNPLTDDGDALRLAVRLNLTIATGIRHCTVTGAHTHLNEPYDGDPVFGGSIITATSAIAATRRAIVRAAAELGRR